MIRYKHHEKDVWVREDLKGKHREYCLCYKCDLWGCPIAEDLFQLCKKHGIVTPVWECSEFKHKY